MKSHKAIIIIWVFVSLVTFFKPAYAGQDTIDITKETKGSVSTKLEICLKSNTININNYKNLEVLYANLLNEKKIIEQRLKTLEDTQKELSSTEQIESEKQKAINEVKETKKTARDILYFLIGALTSFGLHKYFSSKAKYYLVDENYSMAKLFGMLGFIFIGISIILTILFVYFLLTLVFYFFCFLTELYRQN